MQVLRALYFRAADPYLDALDVKRILLAIPQPKRDKITSKLNHQLVQKVSVCSRC